MRRFISVINAGLGPKRSEVETFLAEATIISPDSSRSFHHISDVLEKDEKGKQVLEALGGLDFSIRLFQASEIEEAVLIDAESHTLYVKEFYYYTLVGRVLHEFHTYLSLLFLALNGECSDLLIDLHGLAPEFTKARENVHSSEEREALSLDPADLYRPHLLALIFVARIHAGGVEKVTILEKKVIRDILGTRHAKRLLGLEDSAYRYLEKRESSLELTLGDHERCQTLAEDIRENKLDFDQYVSESLVKKNLLLWIWWTISPFVSADVAILLPMLYESRKIKKIYIDLCQESQAVISDYVAGKNVSEEAVEEEIKKIYPPVLESYQKETLPYLVLLGKLRDFGIPVECFGFSGVELMEREPLLGKDNLLYYATDREWKRVFYQAYQDMTSGVSDDLVIFIHFMKPMFALPPHLCDERLERIIHTDKFTGFGPNKPENGLSLYSRFAHGNGRSFVLPKLSDRKLKDDIIVYFPYMEDRDQPRLDDSQFNRFSLYNTMIYSSHSGGGGGDGKGSFDPVDRFRQPVL